MADNVQATPVPEESPIDKMPSVAEQQQQDLHISHPAMPDVQWARMQPVVVQASKERLDAPHQTVNIRNSSDVVISFNGKVRPQVHIVIDRHMVGHELKPGETKNDVEMLVSEIEYFLRQRNPNRTDIMTGRKKPLHPIEILGFDEKKAAKEKGLWDERHVEKPVGNRRFG